MPPYHLNKLLNFQSYFLRNCGTNAEYPNERYNNLFIDNDRGSIKSVKCVENLHDKQHYNNFFIDRKHSLKSIDAWISATDIASF